MILTENDPLLTPACGSSSIGCCSSSRNIKSNKRNRSCCASLQESPILSLLQQNAQCNRPADNCNEMIADRASASSSRVANSIAPSRATTRWLVTSFSLLAIAFVVAVASRTNMIDGENDITREDNVNSETAIHQRLMADYVSSSLFESFQQQGVANVRPKPHANREDDRHTYKIAFIGNSILYYNDCPRIVQQMIMASSSSLLRHRIDDVQQDSCLRGGATLTSLWEQGNGVIKKFKTSQALISMESLSSSAAFNDDDTFDVDDFHQESATKYSSSTTAQLLDYYDIGADNPKELLEKFNNNNNDVKENGWDFLVMNDNTQGPTRRRTRSNSIDTIKNKIAPLLLQSKPTGGSLRSGDSANERKTRITIPIIIQTQAYRIPGIKGSGDLGDFDEFTDKVAAGVEEYVEAFNEVLEQYVDEEDYSEDEDIEVGNSPTIARIAPVGEAYRYIRLMNPDMFHKLYSWDNMHPSPYGTYLQACIIYMTCFPGKVPPPYNSNWWDASRYIMPPPPVDYKYERYNADSSNSGGNDDDDIHLDRYHYHLEFPDDEEAAELLRIACLICGIMDNVHSH